MNVFKSEATSMTPEILFSPQDNSLFIAGECYPENPTAYFAPVFSVLRSYFDAHAPANFKAVIRLQYVNSAATKALRYLFVLLDDLAERGTAVELNWEFDAEDDALQELGADLAEDASYLHYREHPIQEPAA